MSRTKRQVVLVVPDPGQGGDERGDEDASGAEDGLLGEVEAERVRSRRGDRGDPQPVGGSGVLGEGVHRAAGCGHGCLGCREGDAGAQLPGPQPFRDLLVGVPCGHFGRVDAPEVVPVRVDQREARAYGEFAAGGPRTPAAVPPVSPGERLHLLGVEGAAPSARHATAGELSAAHVGVDGLGLHTQEFGGLLRAQPLSGGAWEGFLIAHRTSPYPQLGSLIGH